MYVLQRPAEHVHALHVVDCGNLTLRTGSVCRKAITASRAAGST